MSADSNDSKCCSNAPLVFANLFLRLWIGIRFLGAGLAKFRSGKGWEHVTFNTQNYKTNTDVIAKMMTENSILPAWMCDSYAHYIGYVLLVVGAWVVVGLCTNLGLIFAGLTALSLGFGLAVLPDDTEVVFIGVHVLIIAAALATSRANKISLDGFFGLFFRGRKQTPAPQE